MNIHDKDNDNGHCKHSYSFLNICYYTVVVYIPLTSICTCHYIGLYVKTFLSIIICLIEFLF